MQHTAIVEAEPLTCDDWLTIGKSIASAHREKQWEMADWFAYGKRRAKEDPQFAAQMALALPEITEDPKRLEQAAKVAEAFPRQERTLALSFDHYAALASLPHGEARKLLEKAEREHIPPRKMIDVAQRMIPTLDDDRLLSGFLTHWNRLPRVVRLDAAEMIAEANGEEIEP